MEPLKITNVCRLLFHLEYMIDVESFRIRSVVDIIQEWYQVKEALMDHLNNFNILSDIQNSAELLKSKDFLLLVQHLKAIKCAVTVIFFVALDIEMQSSCPK